MDSLIECLKVTLPVNAAYHHHKESMAHACAALEIGILAWVMTKDGWKLLQMTAGFTCFVILWALLHLYLRWELRNRRIASVRITSDIDKLVRWSTTGNVEQNTHDPQRHSGLRVVFLDFLIPCFRGTFQNVRIRDEWNLYIGEWVPTAISWLVLLAVLQRKLHFSSWLWDIATRCLCKG